MKYIKQITVAFCFCAAFFTSKTNAQSFNFLENSWDTTNNRLSNNFWLRSFAEISYLMKWYYPLEVISQIPGRSPNSEAIKLTSQYNFFTDYGFVAPGLMGTLYYGHNLTPEDSVPRYENSYYVIGHAYNQRPKYYSGYYKYFPGGLSHYLDSGKIELKLLSNSQIIASIDIVLKDTFPEWTKFNYIIPYTDSTSIPDTIIWISSAMGQYDYSNVNKLYFGQNTQPPFNKWTCGQDGSELHITEIKLSDCYDEEYVYSQNFCYGTIYSDDNFDSLTEAGRYCITLQKTNGCDSTIILNYM